MGVRAPPSSVVIAKSWKAEEKIWTKRLAFNSLIKCNAAMLATYPIPGNPSIRMGSFKVGFSPMSIEQTMTLPSVRYLEKRSDIRMTNKDGKVFKFWAEVAVFDVSFGLLEASVF
jgi:hypothetical protein